MTVCLVTDRRRADPVRQARAATAAEIDFVQVRERDLEAGALAALVRAVMDAVRGAGSATRTRVVVNDRLDVALACGADGVHLREDSMTVADVRSIAPPGFVVGRSVHSVREAEATTGADYLIAGTVFPSTSKPDQRTLLGETGLRAIVDAAPAPVLAVGGIDADVCNVVARAGAAGIAAIGLFSVSEPLDALVRTLRSRFDSVKIAP